MASVNMKNTDYYKSGKHKENCLKAISKANEVQTQKLFARKEQYLLAPSICKGCNDLLKFEKRKNLFCSKSCAASFNNTGRKQTESSKKKVSVALKGRKNPYAVPPIRPKHSPVTHTCRICGIITTVDYVLRKRSTCGSEFCLIQAKVGERKYPNGRRKLFWVFNPNQNKEVLLESSWEVEIAEFLIEHKVNWIRPDPIKWIDGNKKIRFYYPDFYLPDFNVYLDPKNPYGMHRDRFKIEQVSKIITLIVGEISIIKEFVNQKLSVA